MNATRWATVVAGLAVGVAACGAGGTGSVGPDRVVGLESASAASAATKNVVIGTRQVRTYGTILTYKGRSLYIFTEDPKGGSVCNGGCATEWPPVIVPKGAKLSGVAGLGTIKRSDGKRQAALRGRALYLFDEDTAAGQVKGQGDDGDWFVATPTGASHATPKPTPTKSSPPSGGGYGY